jgi:hypothetical protein
MLRIVGRGSTDSAQSWFQGEADFVQHGQLALIRQAFPKYFAKLPVGISFHSAGNRLLVPLLGSSLSEWQSVNKVAHSGTGTGCVLCCLLHSTAKMRCLHIPWGWVQMPIRPPTLLSLYC